MSLAREKKIWPIVIFLTIILHFLFFTVPWKTLFPIRQSSISDYKVDVVPIDPERLEKIRQKWKKRKLLLSKNPDAPKEDSKPNDEARYFSDRTTRVTKEQRARNTRVIPDRQQGASLPSAPRTRAEKKKSRKPKISDLSRLGLPLNFKGGT